MSDELAERAANTRQMRLACAGVATVLWLLPQCAGYAAALFAASYVVPAFAEIQRQRKVEAVNG